jgi:hypothetical protein
MSCGVSNLSRELVWSFEIKKSVLLVGANSIVSGLLIALSGIVCLREDNKFWSTYREVRPRINCRREAAAAIMSRGVWGAKQKWTSNRNDNGAECPQLLKKRKKSSRPPRVSGRAFDVNANRVRNVYTALPLEFESVCCTWDIY